MRREQLELDYSYLRQMLSFAEEIENTLDKVKHYGIDLYDEMVVASLAMDIGQIGEQLDSRKLSSDLQERYADLLPWSEIKRFRDKAYHHYGGTDSYEIVQIALKDIPVLIENLQIIIRNVERELDKDY